MDAGPLLFELPTGRSRKQRRQPAAYRTGGRPQPIRDAILAFLKKQHTAREIADHIGRRVSVATGHLNSMRKRGLVVRIAWGLYIRTDRCDNPPDHASIVRHSPERDAVLQHLDQERSCLELIDLTGKSERFLRPILAKLVAKQHVRKHAGQKWFDDRYIRTSQIP